MTLPPLKGLLALHPARTYPPVGRCIYCGSTVALSDEHVVPLGLGGRFMGQWPHTASSGQSLPSIRVRQPTVVHPPGYGRAP